MNSLVLDLDYPALRKNKNIDNFLNRCKLQVALKQRCCDLSHRKLGGQKCVADFHFTNFYNSEQSSLFSSLWKTINKCNKCNNREVSFWGVIVLLKICWNILAVGCNFSNSWKNAYMFVFLILSMCSDIICKAYPSCYSLEINYSKCQHCIYSLI